MAVACIWVESIGVLLTTSLGSLGDPVLVFAHAFGSNLMAPLLLLLVVNLLAANAPNLYSSGLSLLALDVPVKRWSSVLVGGAIATVLAAWGGTNRISFYEGWLFFVEYWIAPWAAIVLVSFFVFRRRGAEPSPESARPWRMSAIVAYAAAVLIAVPFMPRFVGPVSSALNGLDLSNVVSFLTAAILFYVLASRESAVATGANKAQETSREPAVTSDP
jgi:NCS1 family nucleobase:cation symporter-1